MNNPIRFTYRKLAASLLFVVLFTGTLVVGGFLAAFFPPSFSRLCYGIFDTMGGLLLVYIFLKSEKRSFADIGLVFEKRTPLRFLYGVLIGTGLFLIVILVVCFTTGAHLEKVAAPDYAGMAGAVPAIFFLAFMEEIGFRSYPFVKLEKNYGLLFTQVILALLFAFYHILNGWGVAISFYGPFVWAFVFGLAAYFSGGIALPTGIHFMLNLMQNLVGLKSSAGIVSLVYPRDPSHSPLAPQFAGILSQLLVLLACFACMISMPKRK